jgi:hypothetical protein
MARHNVKVRRAPDLREDAVPAQARQSLHTPTKDEIAALAHALWHARGCPLGSPEVDWHEAELQLQKQRFVREATPAPRRAASAAGYGSGETNL